MIKKIMFFIITLTLIYVSNEIYITLYKWNDPQNCFKKEYVGTIGYAEECKGKLIVDDFTIKNLVLGQKYFKNYGFLFKVILNYDENNIFTGQVTDMYALFKEKDVKYSIKNWNTSKVTNMFKVFW